MTGRRVTWRLTIEYGPTREELGTVELPGVSDAVADVAAQALLEVMGAAFRDDPDGYGCSVRMDRVEHVGRFDR